MEIYGNHDEDRMDPKRTAHSVDVEEQAHAANGDEKALEGIGMDHPCCESSFISSRDAKAEESNKKAMVENSTIAFHDLRSPKNPNHEVSDYRRMPS